MRRRRLARGLTVATVLAVVAGTAFAAVAMANELALRDHPTASSRFGPTTGDGEPPPCDAPVTIGSSARLELHLMADLDGRPIGSVDLAGDRAGTNFRWLAYVASTQRAGPARRGPDRERGVGSQAVQRVAAERARRRRRRHGRRPGVRDRADARKSATRPRTTASRSSRAPGPRRCRIAVDGPTFRRGVPAGRLARRRRRPAPLARPARLLGLPRRRARPGRRQRQRRGGRDRRRTRSRARSRSA